MRLSQPLPNGMAESEHTGDTVTARSAAASDEGELNLGARTLRLWSMTGLSLTGDCLEYVFGHIRPCWASEAPTGRPLTCQLPNPTGQETDTRCNVPLVHICGGPIHAADEWQKQPTLEMSGEGARAYRGSIDR